MNPVQSEISSTEIVAGEVRAWMGRRQRSTRSVALELGWTETFLGRRLKGLQPFKVDELAAVAELLDVPVSRFRRMIQENVTAEIRAEIGRQDLSQEALAKALGWEPSKLRRRLKGRVSWSIDEIEQIASVLDVPRFQLLDPPIRHRRAVS